MVPMEFFGLARQLRRDVATATQASKAVIDELLAPLGRGIKRRGHMRSEEISGFAREWTLAPQPTNRISLSIQTKGKRIFVHDVFLSSAELKRPQWADDDWEQGIVLAELHVQISRSKVETAEADLAAFSLHSIARRYERSTKADRTDASVMRDIAVAPHPNTMPAGGFSVVPVGCGRWVGERVNVNDKPVRIVRFAMPCHSTAAKAPVQKRCKSTRCGLIL